MYGKKYINLALIYSVVAMIFGVFYREFTKLNGFAGQTSLSFMHTHYFILGMFFFLILLLVQKNYSFSSKKTSSILVVYQIGLNITGLGFLLRGLVQVLGTELTKGMNAAISGIAGIGHILLGVCIVLLLLEIRNKVVKSL